MKPRSALAGLAIGLALIAVPLAISMPARQRPASR
jgi:hypothetical protein